MKDIYMNEQLFNNKPTNVKGFDSEEQNSALKMRISCLQNRSEVIVVFLTGYIDTYNTNYFSNKIDKILSAGYMKLVLDCSQLNYMSSTGIGSMTGIMKALKAKGGEIILVSIQSKVMDVFELLGFSSFFAIKNSYDEVIKYLDCVKETTISIFPRAFNCPMCRTRLKTSKAGKFRCAHCKTIIEINLEGRVSLV